MPNVEKDIELEKLKGDPNMWMRLTMLSEDGSTMENVFTDKENPFIKNSAGAMDKIQSLANEGRLYLREEGRSRHFHAVNKDGDSLKLGEQREMKMDKTASGTGSAVLMWLSKNYFKWIGLDALSRWLGFDGISNWFEKRLQARRDAIEVDDRYSKEYKAMGDRRKKELKALRKHEKNLKKLEKIQKEAELSEQTLNELRGQQTPATTQQEPTAPQQQAPLTQPPEIKPNENTMQPTLTGDAPVQQTPPVSKAPTRFAVQQQTAQQEIIGEKKEKTEEKENSNRIIFRGVEYTAENINELPENIRNAVQQLQNVIEQYDREQEQAKTNGQNTEIPFVDMNSPISQPPEPEPEKVSIQPQQMEQQTDLQKRLAAEKEAMDSVANWKDRLVNTLFSHKEGSTLKEYYDMIKDKPAGPDFLAGTVCGLLSAAGDPESSKQILEGLVGGKPLGSEYDNRINEGVTAYNRAVEQMNNGNREPMTKLITDAALALGRQASQEDGLSPRHVMIGRMISNAMSLADQHDLRLKLNEEQWATIRGAYQLSRLAQNHHNAKQLLGKEPMDVASEEGRSAARDLLMGNAVEKMIQLGKYHKQEITDIQLLMGCGCLNVDNLTKMMSSTQIRKDITPEQVKEALEMPNGYDSARMAKQLGEELLTIAREGTAPVEKNRQMDMQKQNEPEKAQQLPPPG